MSTNAYFMIEGGRALEMVKHHIAEVQRVRAANKLLAEELGATEMYVNRSDGTMTAARFAKGVHHPDFKKADRKGMCYPKRGSEWAKRLAALVGRPDPATVIVAEFKVPVSLSYTQGDSKGWTCIGNPLYECGWLYLGPDGPYAMWTPDVAAIVKQFTVAGKAVLDGVDTWKLDVPGVRPIHEEEWDVLVAQHRLAQRLDKGIEK